ncbi:hypothetical protein D210916BOD24_30340 [Alteromonas sp. D210916BOD_24]
MPILSDTTNKAGTLNSITQYSNNELKSSRKQNWALGFVIHHIHQRVYFLVKYSPISPAVIPITMPKTKSAGQCAPTATLDTATTEANMKSPTVKPNFIFGEVLLLRINTNRIADKAVKIVVVCPEGKLVWAVSVFPMMVKVLLSKIAAGRGIEKKCFPK